MSSSLSPLHHATKEKVRKLFTTFAARLHRRYMLASIFQSLIHKNKGKKIVERFSLWRCTGRGQLWCRQRDRTGIECVQPEPIIQSNQLKSKDNNRREKKKEWVSLRLRSHVVEQHKHGRPDLKLDTNAKWHKRSNPRVNVVAPVRTFPIINCKLENAINCEFSLATRYWIIIIGSKTLASAHRHMHKMYGQTSGYNKKKTKKTKKKKIQIAKR